MSFESKIFEGTIYEYLTFISLAPAQGIRVYLNSEKSGIRGYDTPFKLHFQDRPAETYAFWDTLVAVIHNHANTTNGVASPVNVFSTARAIEKTLPQASVRKIVIEYTGPDYVAPEADTPASTTKMDAHPTVVEKTKSADDGPSYEPTDEQSVEADDVDNPFTDMELPGEPDVTTEGDTSETVADDVTDGAETTPESAFNTEEGTQVMPAMDLVKHQYDELNARDFKIWLDTFAKNFDNIIFKADLAKGKKLNMEMFEKALDAIPE